MRIIIELLNENQLGITMRPNDGPHNPQLFSMRLDFLRKLIADNPAHTLQIDGAWTEDNSHELSHIMQLFAHRTVLFSASLSPDSLRIGVSALHADTYLVLPKDMPLDQAQVLIEAMPAEVTLKLDPGTTNKQFRETMVFLPQNRNVELLEGITCWKKTDATGLQLVVTVKPNMDGHSLDMMARLLMGCEVSPSLYMLQEVLPRLAGALSAETRLVVPFGMSVDDIEVMVQALKYERVLVLPNDKVGADMTRIVSVIPHHRGVKILLTPDISKVQAGVIAKALPPGNTLLVTRDLGMLHYRRIANHIQPGCRLELMQDLRSEQVSEIASRLTQQQVTVRVPRGISTEAAIALVKAGALIELDDAITIPEADAIVRHVVLPESLIYAHLSEDKCQAIAQGLRAHAKAMCMFSSLLPLNEVIEDVMHLPEGSTLRLLPGRSQGDYQAIIDAIPPGCTLCLPKQVNEAMLQALAAATRPCRFTMDHATTTADALAMLAYMTQPYAFVLPKDMPFETQRAVVEAMPVTCGLELTSQMTKAAALAVVNVMSNARLLVPTRLCQEDGTPYEHDTWLRELVMASGLRDIMLPTGIALSALEALAGELPRGKTMILSPQLTPEEVALLAVATTKAQGTLYLASGMSMDSYGALGAVTQPGFRVLSPNPMSEREAAKIASSINVGTTLWILPSQPGQADLSVKACQVLARSMKPDCSIGLYKQLPTALMCEIARCIQAGVILRAASTLDKDQLLALAAAVRPGGILEIGESTLAYAPDIAEKLNPGAILRLPRQTTIEQFQNVANKINRGVVLEIPKWYPKGGMVRCMESLREGGVITFPSHLFGSLMQSGCEEKLSAARKTMQTAMESLPKGCGIRLPLGIDLDSFGLFVSQMPQGCTLWIPAQASMDISIHNRDYLAKIGSHLRAGCHLGLPTDLNMREMTQLLLNLQPKITHVYLAADFSEDRRAALLDYIHRNLGVPTTSMAYARSVAESAMPTSSSLPTTLAPASVESTSSSATSLPSLLPLQTYTGTGLTSSSSGQPSGPGLFSPPRSAQVASNSHASQSETSTSSTRYSHPKKRFLPRPPGDLSSSSHAGTKKHCTPDARENPRP